MLWRFFPQASEALMLCFVVFDETCSDPGDEQLDGNLHLHWKLCRGSGPKLVKIHQIHKKTLRKWRWTWWTWWKWSSLKMDMFCHGRGCFGRTWAPTTFSPAWPCCCIGRFWWTLPSLATKHDRSFFSDHQVLEIRHQQIETNRNKSKIPGDLPFFDFWRSLWVILWYIYQSIWVYLHIPFLQRCSGHLHAPVCLCLGVPWRHFCQRYGDLEKLDPSG